MSGAVEPRRTWSALAVAAALAAQAGTPGGAPDGPAAAVVVPRFPTAREQLEHADRERAGLRDVPRDRLAGERRRVAVDYAAVRIRFPRARKTAAEASLRAAELWRQAGETEWALAELEQARRLGSGGDLAARAGLELGHLERRRRRWSRALDRYLEAASEAAASARWRDEASLWAGKTYAASGELDEARRRLAHLGGAALDPLLRIRAFDEWALTYLVDDDAEAAAGVLARCREALAEPGNEATELGERVRNALSRMRCIPAIERAVAKRHGTRVVVARDDEE